MYVSRIFYHAQINLHSHIPCPASRRFFDTLIRWPLAWPRCSWRKPSVPCILTTVEGEKRKRYIIFILLTTCLFHKGGLWAILHPPVSCPLQWSVPSRHSLWGIRVQVEDGAERSSVFLSKCPIQFPFSKAKTINWFLTARLLCHECIVHASTVYK